MVYDSLRPSVQAKWTTPCSATTCTCETSSCLGPDPIPSWKIAGRLTTTAIAAAPANANTDRGDTGQTTGSSHFERLSRRAASAAISARTWMDREYFPLYVFTIIEDRRPYCSDTR